MYKVYCDNQLIHHFNVDELKITNAVLELEQNEIGTFKFNIFPTNPYINKIKKMQSAITVYQNDFIIFRGIACHDEIGYKNQKIIQCKQDYYFLTFSIQRPYEFSGSVKELFEYFINNHNEQVDVKDRFKVGEITVTDPNDYIVRSDSTYLSTWESIQKKLIEMLGGYLRIRYEDDGVYIDYVEDFIKKSVQEITFGENLLDVKKEASSLDVATVLIPLGAKIEGETRLNIASVNDGKDYIVNEDALERYRKIITTETWDDVTEPQNLLRKAKEFLNKKAFQITQITINAIDMAYIKKDISHFRMFNYIKVNSKFHEIDDYYLPLKMSINLFYPQGDKITLNGITKSLTDSQVDESNKLGNVIEEIVTIKKDVGNVSERIEEANDSIIEMNKELSSSIVQAKDEITQEVKESFYTKDDTNRLVSEVGTVLSQTKTFFEMQFNTFQQNLDELATGQNANFDDLRKYIRFEDGKIILGQVGNELVLQISNDRISFMQSNNEVAYISNSKLYITSGEIIHSLRIGNFSFLPRDNGSLDFKKVGD